MKKVKRHIVRLAVLAVAAVLAAGCGISKIKDLSVTSVGVKYLVPTSSRSLDAVLLLGLDNPSITFTVSDVEGTVRYYDRELAYLTAGELPVQARSVQVYELPCSATLAEKVSFLDLLALGSKKSLDGVTVDVKLHVKLRNGAGTTLNFNRIDLSQYTQ